MHQKVSSEAAFTRALKSTARSQEIKAKIQQSPELYGWLLRAAKRYVTGESRFDGLEAGGRLLRKGYRISLEYIGENTSSEIESREAAEEFANLIRDGAQAGLNARISLDLSHIGLSVAPELAREHMLHLAREARTAGQEIVISMEESEKTDAILAVYKQIAAESPNVGITLQAQLHRSAADLTELLEYPGLIRIVKGAYEEPSGLYLPRSEALNDRYIAMVDACITAGHAVSIASHDDAIVNRILEKGYLQSGGAELEMLYGIRPELASRLRSEGFNVRLYLTYGTDWYLYLCHRIAEHPPNLYDAVVDLLGGSEEGTDRY